MAENTARSTVQEAGSELLITVNSLIANDSAPAYPVEILIGIENKKNTHIYRAKLNENSIDGIREIMTSNLKQYGGYKIWV